MKALVGALNQEKGPTPWFWKPMDRFTALTPTPDGMQSELWTGEKQSNVAITAAREPDNNYWWQGRFCGMIHSLQTHVTLQTCRLVQAQQSGQVSSSRRGQSPGILYPSSPGKSTGRWSTLAAGCCSGFCLVSVVTASDCFWLMFSDFDIDVRADRHNIQYLEKLPTRALSWSWFDIDWYKMGTPENKHWLSTLNWDHIDIHWQEVWRIFAVKTVIEFCR